MNKAVLRIIVLVIVLLLLMLIVPSSTPVAIGECRMPGVAAAEAVVWHA